jgi:hypothetical protein
MATSAGDLVYQQQTSAPKPPKEMCPGLPEAWNQLILDAISLDASRRPQTARDLARRMIAATDRGPDIARATAPLLFTRPSEPFTGADSQPLVPDWSSSAESSAPARPTGTVAPPPRPAQTEAPPARPNPTVDTPASSPSSPLPSWLSQSSSSMSPSDSRPEAQALALVHPTLPPVPGSIPPDATRNLRSRSASHPVVSAPPGSHRPRSITGPPPPSLTGPPRPPSEGVPTTLGMTASEIPVYEGTVMTTAQSQRRSRWPLWMALIGLMAGAGLGGLFLVGKSKGETQPATQPEPQDPEPEVTPVPTAVPIDDRPAMVPDAQPTAVIIDAGVPDAKPEPPDAAPRRTGRSERRTGGSRPKSKPDAAPPLSDDELFDSRK